MAFDASKYANKSPKPMHVFLLLDTSGSMDGEKIVSLATSVKEMMESFSSLEKEVEIKISLISFSDTAELLIKAQNSELALNKLKDLRAYGLTSMGAAFNLVKQLIEDREVLPSRSYRPLIVLVSDGAPTDQYLDPLNALINEGRSQKAQRMALAIGQDANRDVLQQFIGKTADNDNEPHLFYASGAKDIHNFFKFVTMSVTTTTTSKASLANVNYVGSAVASDNPAEMFKHLSAQQPSSLASQELATPNSPAQQQVEDPYHGDRPFAPQSAGMNRVDAPYHGEKPASLANRTSRANNAYATSQFGGFNQAPSQHQADKLKQAHTPYNGSKSDQHSSNSQNVQTPAPAPQDSPWAHLNVDAPSKQASPSKPDSSYVVHNLSEDEDWPF